MALISSLHPVSSNFRFADFERLLLVDENVGSVPLVFSRLEEFLVYL
jgi:hypothetical protein